MSDFVTYAQIEAALPAPLVWTQDDLIRIGRQSHSPLRHIRKGNRTTQPLWSRPAVVAWFRKTYANAPELVSEFEAKLTPKPSKKAERK